MHLREFVDHRNRYTMVIADDGRCLHTAVAPSAPRDAHPPPLRPRRSTSGVDCHLTVTPLPGGRRLRRR
jgi:hypothetical protein